MRFPRYSSVTAIALALASPAHAQLVFEREPLNVTVEGYASFTGAQNASEDNVANSIRDAAHADAWLRVLGLTRTESGLKLGAGLEALSTTEDTLEAGERSLLAISDWGRVQLGKRRGLPNVLTGYAPNAYTFTSAEFGLSSGRTLDPGGTLPTAFLSTPVPCRRLPRYWQQAPKGTSIRRSRPSSTRSATGWSRPGRTIALRPAARARGRPNATTKAMPGCTCQRAPAKGSSAAASGQRRTRAER